MNPSVAFASRRGPGIRTPIRTLSFLAVIVLAGHPAQAAPAAAPPSRGGNIELPVVFEANHGQLPQGVRFASQGSAYTLLLGDQEMTFLSRRQSEDGDTTPPAAIRMRCIGAEASAQVSAEAPLKGRKNYLQGNDPSAWRRDVPLFRKVRYAGIYPGIDLVFYERDRQLEFDFVIAPGADPGIIEFALEGGDDLTLDSSGAAVLHHGEETFRLRPPVAYQDSSGTREPVTATFEIDPERRRLGFRLGDHDPARPLVIDPEIRFSTYLDLSLSVKGIAFDQAGALYVSGVLYGALPTGAQGIGTGGSDDAFVLKLNADEQLVYLTVVGGSSYETARNPDYLGFTVAVDSAGRAAMVGSTQSIDFPVYNAAQPEPKGVAQNMFGRTDVFVFLLNPQGNGFEFSTYLGSIGYDTGVDVAVDATGNVYATGDVNGFHVGPTSESDFPLVNALFPHQLQGNEVGQTPDNDTFLTKFSPSGTIIYSTFLGFLDQSCPTRLRVDAQGNAYIIGYTSAERFRPTPGAFQSSDPNPAEYNRQGFAAKVNAAGTGLDYATLIASATRYASICWDLSIDPDGHAYIVAESDNSLPASAGAYMSTPATPTDAFLLTKLNPTGTGLDYLTFLPGQYTSGQPRLALNPDGNTYVAYHTTEANLPLMTPLAGITQPPAPTADDIYILELTSDATDLLFASYLGGTARDVPKAMDLISLPDPANGNQPADVIALGGWTQSTDFPLVNPLHSTGGGASVYSPYITVIGPATETPLQGQPWEIIDFDGDYNTASYTYQVRFERVDNEATYSAEAPVLRQTDETITARVPVGILGTADDFMARRATMTSELVTVVITRDNGAVEVARIPFRVLFPQQLIYDQVAVAPVASPQHVLPQFPLPNSNAVEAFFVRGQSEDGRIAFRARNTTLYDPAADWPPLRLETVAFKLAESPPIAVNPINAATVPNQYMGQRNHGITFDITQDGIYIFVAAQETTNGTVLSPGPFPAPAQVHLAGDVGLPRKLINLALEPEYGTRQDILFNHPAPRPQTLTSAATNPPGNNAAQTALFKFASQVSSRRIPAAVMTPPAGGLIPGTRIVRAADPATALDLTTPTAQSPGTGVAGTATILDFTQVPWPSRTAPAAPVVQGTIGALLGITETFTTANPVIFDMGSGHEIVDGSGSDFEIATVSGSYQVAVGNSPYEDSFTAIGTSYTGNQSLDLAGTGLGSARFVRLTPDGQAELTSVTGLNVFADSTIQDVGPVVRMPLATMLARRTKAPASTLDPFLRLLGTDGAFLGENEAGFGESLSLDLSDAVLADADLASTSFHRFLVKGYDVRPDAQSTGAVFVRLETTGAPFDTGDIVVSGANEINTTAQKQGSFVRSRQRDSYTFEATPGQTINAVVIPRGVPPHAQPTIELFDPEELMIGAASDFPTAGRAVLSLTLPVNSLAGTPLPTPATWRIVVGALDKRGTTPISFGDGGHAYLRQPASGLYSLKLFTGSVHPSIVIVAPTSIATGEAITITGRDFAPTPAGNLVRFNSTTAAVTTASPSQLVATVPSGLTPGSHPVTVTVDGMTSNPVDVTVTQSTQQPDIQVSPASLAFGSVLTGQSGTLDLTITNAGGADLELTSATSSNPRFTITPPPPATIPASGQQVLTVTFQALEVGEFPGSLSLASNDPDTPSLALGMVGYGTAAAGSAIAQFRITGLSLYIPPASGTVGTDPFTLSLSSFDPTQPNDELNFVDVLIDASSLTAIGGDPLYYSHAAAYALDVGSGAMTDLGDIEMDVPGTVDANSNGFPDFFEVEQAVAGLTTGGAYYTELGAEGTVSATWTRTAGSRSGICALVLSDEFGLGSDLEADATFELLDYSGDYAYSNGESQVTGSIEWTPVPGSRPVLTSTLSANPAFTKTSPDHLDLLEGTMVDANSASVTYLPFEFSRSSNTYLGAMELETPDWTYLSWAARITDQNDGDGDGIPDLGDEPGTTPGGIDAWRRRFFSAGELANPSLENSLWGDLADPNHNGITNLIEYFTGHHPRVPNSTGALALRKDPDRVRLVYQRAKSASGVSGGPQWSADLAGWTTAGLTEQVIEDRGESELVEVTLPAQAGNGTAFARLSVSRNP